MNPLLMVCNPRNMQACVDSIERLPVDQAWLTGYWEAELEPVIAYVVATTDYSHYLMCSDDVVVPEFALEAVLDALDDGHPVVTGYCNMDHTNFLVNLTKTPFQNVRESTVEDYDLYDMSEIMGWPDELVPTCFAGFALTGMSRDMWLQYPYGSEGVPSDYNLCRRLQADGVPIVAPKRAFMWHDKVKAQEGGVGPRRLLVGQVAAEVRWRQDRRVAA